MTKFSDETDSYDLRLTRESDSAWLCQDVDGYEAWLPKGIVEFPTGARVGQTVTVELPNWLAEDRGLI